MASRDNVQGARRGERVQVAHSGGHGARYSVVAVDFLGEEICSGGFWTGGGGVGWGGEGGRRGGQGYTWGVGDGVEGVG
jgi:hypothetical protein